MRGLAWNQASGAFDAPSMTFAEILKEMRLELGLSQPACAAYLGISRRTLQYWEAGEERHIPHVLMQEGAIARLTTLLTN